MTAMNAQTAPTDRSQPTAQEMALAFEGYTKRELSEMLAHILKTYVFDGVQPTCSDVGIVDFPRHLRDLAFPQLIAQLQMHLDLPELNLFTVSGGQVLVKLGGRDFSLSNPHEAPPPVAEPPAAERSAGASRGDRGDRGDKPAAKADEKPAPVEISDRFRMLELD